MAAASRRQIQIAASHSRARRRARAHSTLERERRRERRLERLGGGRTRDERARTREIAALWKIAKKADEACSELELELKALWNRHS